ncbi:MAG TPA: dienelactone hydrolase family protein [Armatimonadota bacterium]|jgi:dienelactone hydrolase
MQTAVVVLLLLGLSMATQAAIKTETVTYQAGDTVCQGYLADDDAGAGPRPGVLVFPEWWGVNDFPRERARQLAELGYVALVADMYGDGLVATDPAEAGKLAGQFRGAWDTGGRQLMRERAAAALAELVKNPRVDRQRVAAIGFCFGGTCALELAYSGAVLGGVVTFHGGLTVPEAADLARIKAHLLILHGADDPTIKPETITALQEALRQGKVDWEMIYYGGAVHGFTNPANVPAAGSPVAYNEIAARRSGQAMRDFLAEVFAKP